jgi:23S rRNA G2069 N7-methylase RlmK/C1962 C5-methylase RlmI
VDDRDDGAPAKTAEQAEMLSNRISKNLRVLDRAFRREAVTCKRVYDHDIPEIPLVIDAIHDESGVAYLHLAEYARPHDRSPDEHDEWLDALTGAAAATLRVAEEHTFLKRRERKRRAAQYERFSRVGEASVTPIVVEAGRRFELNLSDYLDMGLFLDHRTTRGLIGARASGKRVLNLYAYTGSFSVYAATAGASHVTTVDWSNTYLEWATRNFKLNGLDPASRNYRFMRADAMSWLESADSDVRFDVIVVDPPTFSNRTDRDTFDVQRDHERLVTLCLERLAPQGNIMFSTNFRRFRPGAVLSDFREISAETVPPDFRDRKIHRAFVGGPW